MRFVRLTILLGFLGVLLPASRAVHAQRVEQGSSCTSPVTAAPGAGFQAYVDGQNALGFGLLSTLIDGAPKDNAFISPTSLELAVSMAYDGARGTTARAMASTLGLGSLSHAATRQQARALLARLETAGTSSGLSVASSLWARQGVAFKPAFLTHVRQSYGAAARVLNFGSPSAPGTINAWVSCATQGKITSIISRIQPEEVMFLINAVYFHGDWAQPFDPAATHGRSFNTAVGAQIQVPLMSHTAPFSYYRGGNFQAVRLPYTNPRFSMVVVLPNASVSLPAFARQLRAGWSRWTAAMRTETGALSLPRFSIQNTFQLNGALSKLGMGNAFSRNADFSGICVQRCFLTQVRHKTYLAVNEKGTVAAAVTSVGVGATAIPVAQFQMVVDHPFFVAIQDSTTHAVLFTGLVTNPTG